MLISDVASSFCSFPPFRVYEGFLILAFCRCGVDFFICFSVLYKVALVCKNVSVLLVVNRARRGVSLVVFGLYY